MKSNPNSPIIRTGSTRDGVTAFLHEDGTVSDRLRTLGFTTLNADIMHRYFDNIGAVHSFDVPKSIKAANKGRLPFLANEALLEAESRARVERARIQIEHERTVVRRVML